MSKRLIPNSTNYLTDYPPLIFVYLGKIPKYCRANLRIASQQFSGEIILLTDDPEITEIPGVRVEHVKDWYEPGEFQRLEEASPLDSGFRSGFWLRAIERFFVLSAYARRTGIARFFHCELDVLVIDLEGVPDFLDIHGSGIFAPMPSAHQVIASFVYVNDRNSLSAFCDYAIEHSFLGNEMAILASFFQQHSDKAHSLPTEASLVNAKGFSPSVVEQSGGIFDAANLGHWYFGQDPSNTVGLVWNHWREKARERVVEKIRSRTSICDRGLEIRGFDSPWLPVRVLHVHSKAFNVIKWRLSFAFFVWVSNFAFRAPVVVPARSLAYFSLKAILSIADFTPRALRLLLGRLGFTRLMVLIALRFRLPMSDRLRSLSLKLFPESIPLKKKSSSDIRAYSAKALFEELSSPDFATLSDSPLQQKFIHEISVFWFALNRADKPFLVHTDDVQTPGKFLKTSLPNQPLVFLQAENEYALVQSARRVWPKEVAEVPWRPSTKVQVINPETARAMFGSEEKFAEWVRELGKLSNPQGASLMAYGLWLLSQEPKKVRLIKDPLA